MVKRILASVILMAICLGARAEEKAICRVNGSTAEIGIEGRQKYVFSRADDLWECDGLFAFIGNGWTKAADALLPQRINSIATSGRGRLTLAGEGFTATFSVDGNSPFIERNFDFTFSPDKSEIAEREINLQLSFVDCTRERGFIGSYSERDTCVYIFSPIPAIYSRIERRDGSAVALTQVIDYYGSAPVFRKAMRRYNAAQRNACIAVFSCPAELQGHSCSYHDRIMLSDGSATDFYDQLRLIRAEFSRVSPYNGKASSDMYRLAVEDYSTAAEGLQNELLDMRAQGPAGTMRGYAYSGYGGESFIGLNIYRSMIKYAEATGNRPLYDFCLDRTMMFVNNENGVHWIEDAYGFGDFFHYARGVDHFNDNDNSEIARGRHAMGTYKGFERVDALGEMAIYTGNAELKEGFLRLARTMHEKMVMPDFCQPVCYSLPSLEPLAGTDDGGSAGGAAIWADIMLMASELTEGEESSIFLSDAISSARRAADLGFQQMWSILDAPKSVAVARTVSTLVELWKKTGDRSLLESAEKVANGLYHFYHYFNHTYSPFCTTGMGIACSIERQEAAYESMLAIWQVAPLLDHTDDRLLLDLFMQARNSGYFFYPVNSQGIGTVHSEHRTTYEWPESEYVPYEFATGVLHDPAVRCSAVDMVQNIFRETKEIYGSGETFAFSLLFDGKAVSVNPEVCCICTNANLRHQQDEDRFVLFNPSDKNLNAPLVFRNLKDSAYNILVDSRTFMKNVDAGRMANGIVFPVKANSVSRITITPTRQAITAQTLAVKVPDADCKVNSSLVSINVQPVKKAAFYKLYYSRSAAFNDLNTSVMYSSDGEFKLRPDGMEKVFCRIEAIDKAGNIVGLRKMTVDVPGMRLLAQDDFSRGSFLSDRGGESGWTEINTDFRSDGSRGVMNILQDDIGYGISEIQKTFEVDCTAGMRFELVPVALPDRCTMKVLLEVDGKEYMLTDGISNLDEPIYSYPLDNLSGKKDIKVRICTEGSIRGCILECVRFVADSDSAEDRDVDILGLAAAESGVLHISNMDGGEKSLSYCFTTNLERNRNLVIDVENFRGMNSGAQWKLLLKDRETGEMLEVRNMYEIDGFNPEDAFKSYRNPSNDRYYRSKSGVYMYDVYTMSGIDGMHDYELVLLVSRQCELDIARLYLTESNTQVPVCPRNLY